MATANLPGATTSPPPHPPTWPRCGHARPQLQLSAPGCTAASATEVQGLQDSLLHLFSTCLDAVADEEDCASEAASVDVEIHTACDCNSETDKGAACTEDCTMLGDLETPSAARGVVSGGFLRSCNFDCFDNDTDIVSVSSEDIQCNFRDNIAREVAGRQFHLWSRGFDSYLDWDKVDASTADDECLESASTCAESCITINESDRCVVQETAKALVENMGLLSEVSDKCLLVLSRQTFAPDSEITEASSVAHSEVAEITALVAQVCSPIQYFLETGSVQEDTKEAEHMELASSFTDSHVTDDVCVTIDTCVFQETGNTLTKNLGLLDELFAETSSTSTHESEERFVEETAKSLAENFVWPTDISEISSISTHEGDRCFVEETTKTLIENSCVRNDDPETESTSTLQSDICFVKETAKALADTVGLLSDAAGTVSTTIHESDKCILTETAKALIENIHLLNDEPSKTGLEHINLLNARKTPYSPRRDYKKMVTDVKVQIEMPSEAFLACSLEVCKQSWRPAVADTNQQICKEITLNARSWRSLDGALKDILQRRQQASPLNKAKPTTSLTLSADTAQQSLADAERSALQRSVIVKPQELAQKEKIGLATCSVPPQHGRPEVPARVYATGSPMNACRTREARLPPSLAQSHDEDLRYIPRALAGAGIRIPVPKPSSAGSHKGICPPRPSSTRGPASPHPPTQPASARQRRPQSAVMRRPVSARLPTRPVS